MLLALAMTSVLASCADSGTGGTAFTAAQGPADAALPYQAVFAVNENTDERLVSAAKNFCERTAEFSRGSAVFSLVSSKNALQDLQLGKADMILLENTDAAEFSPLTEAFRYKSYEHFSMAANSNSTLRILSDMLGANVFAGFYAGSDVFLSHGTLDSKFKPLPRKDTENSQDSKAIPVTALSDATARAFSLLKADVTTAKELDARILALSVPGSAVEFSHSELDSPSLLLLLESLHANTLEVEDLQPQGASEGERENVEPVPAETEPLVATQAFTGIKPVWLVFAESSYEKLSQTNRAAAAEAAAYMVSDIDGSYLQYERKILELLAAADITVSREFAATRTQALRLADESASTLTGKKRALRESIAKTQ